MANPLNNEKELFDRIKTEGITIAPDIWNFLYNHIGDDITAINLLCQYHLDNGQSISPTEAEKLVIYATDAGNIINNLCLRDKQNPHFPEFTEDIPLHPVVREMLTHYIGNDTQVINFMIGTYIEMDEPMAVPKEVIPKVLAQTESLKEFMEKLREATYKTEERP